jgi:hypothetical protein
VSHPAAEAASSSARAGAPWRDRRLRALLLGALAAVVLHVRSPRLACRDFCTYYAAGTLALEGRPEAAYDHEALAAAHRAAHAEPRGVGPWLYSPLWLPVVALAAALPFEPAEAVARGAAAAGLGLGLALVLLRISARAGGLGLELAVAAAFVLSHPGWIQLAFLNLSWLLFALVAAAWWASSTGRAGASALAWALAVHLKPFVGLALVALWIARRRRVVGRAALVAVLLAALALPAVGTASWARYLGFLGQTRTAGVTPFYNKLSLQATVARFQSEPRQWVAPRAPVSTPTVRWLFWLALPLWGWGAARLRRHPDAALAFTLAFLLLAVPQIWDHTEILLFAALSALPRGRALALAALLAASVAYNALQQPLLMEVLRREKPPLALQSLLLYFPALNLLALGAALEAATRAGTGRSEPAGDARAA